MTEIEQPGIPEVDDQLVVDSGEGREPGQPTLDQSPGYRPDNTLDMAP